MSSPTRPPPASGAPIPPRAGAPPAPGAAPSIPGAPQAPTAAQSPKRTIQQVVPIEMSSGTIVGSDAIVIYGTEGIGKSTLASYLPSPFFFDMEKSTRHLSVYRDRALFENPTWPLLRGKVAGFAKSPPPEARSLVIDTATSVQSLIVDHVVDTKPAVSDKGTSVRAVSSIEDYGWGKGWKYVAEEFDAMLSDVDKIRARGIFVCMICHAVPAPFVNPLGEDFTRYEPHLYPGDRSRSASIRDRVKQWADHVLFVGYDLFVKDGKGIGSGTRSIYTTELPSHAAKSRTVQTMQNFDSNDPGAIWRTLGIQK